MPSHAKSKKLPRDLVWGDWRVSRNTQSEEYRTGKDAKGNRYTETRPLNSGRNLAIPRTDRLEDDFDGLNIDDPLGQSDQSPNHSYQSYSHTQHLRGEEKGKGKPTEDEQQPYTEGFAEEGTANLNENDEEFQAALASTSNSYHEPQAPAGPSNYNSSPLVATGTTGTYYLPSDPQGYNATGGVTQASKTHWAGNPSASNVTYTSHNSTTWKDSRYGVQPSKYYIPGEVFKVVWAEPQGQTSKKSALNALNAHREAPFTEQNSSRGFYTGVRRFVVVASESGSSVCVPVLTYEDRGCSKPGVKAKNHGVVYKPPNPITLVRGEGDLGFFPVRMLTYTEGETITDTSRINYSKLITIEHNISVLFIGRIFDDDFHIVCEAVDACWERRIRHGRHSGHR